ALILTGFFAIASLPFATRAIACEGEGHQQATFKTTNIPEVASWLNKQAAYVFDANDKTTRDKYGVIAGASTLTSARTYDLRELPPNKDAKLVFYCGGPKCMSSHGAAERALAAGYTDVNVMPEGIKGWVDAGRPTSKSPRS